MKTDRVPALTFMGIGMIALIALLHLPMGTIKEPDTAFFPVLLSGLLIVLSSILLGKSLMTKLAAKDHLWKDRWNKLIPSVSVFVAYSFMLKPVGYVVCTLLILFFFARMEKCSWKASLLISTLCTFLSYALFRWYLQSPLPQGMMPF